MIGGKFLKAGLSSALVLKHNGGAYMIGGKFLKAGLSSALVLGCMAPVMAFADTTGNTAVQWQLDESAFNISVPTTFHGVAKADGSLQFANNAKFVNESIFDVYGTKYVTAESAGSPVSLVQSVSGDNQVAVDVTNTVNSNVYTMGPASDHAVEGADMQLAKSSEVPLSVAGSVNADPVATPTALFTVEWHFDSQANEPKYSFKANKTNVMVTKSTPKPYIDYVSIPINDNAGSKENVKNLYPKQLSVSYDVMQSNPYNPDEPKQLKTYNVNISSSFYEYNLDVDPIYGETNNGTITDLNFQLPKYTLFLNDVNGANDFSINAGFDTEDFISLNVNFVDPEGENVELKITEHPGGSIKNFKELPDYLKLMGNNKLDENALSFVVASKPSKNADGYYDNIDLDIVSSNGNDQERFNENSCTFTINIEKYLGSLHEQYIKVKNGTAPSGWQNVFFNEEKGLNGKAKSALIGSNTDVGNPNGVVNVFLSLAYKDGKFYYHMYQEKGVSIPKISEYYEVEDFTLVMQYCNKYIDNAEKYDIEFHLSDVDTRGLLQ